MQSTNAGGASSWKLERIPPRVLLLCLFAALAAVLLFETSWAQGEPEHGHVDLVMLYEYGTGADQDRVRYIVRNTGTATATGVTVSFLLEDLQAGTFKETRGVQHPTDMRTENSTNQRFTWEIGTILPGEASLNLRFSTKLHDGHTSANRIGVITATASANQPEPGILSANNVITIYSLAASTAGGTLHMEGNRLALLLSVDDLRPGAGDDLDFDLRARNFNVGQTSGSYWINLIADIEIKVELSGGLRFKSGWSPTGVTVAPGRQSATWTPEAVDVRTDVGNQMRPSSRDLEIQTELTSDSLDDIPLEDRCITAWVSKSTPPPSADYVLGSLKQCLRDEPTVLIEEGELDLFTLDVTAQNDLGLEVRVNQVQRPQLRSHGIAREDVMLSSEKVVVQVKDSSATRGSVTDNSVTSVTWQTKGGDANSGVEVRENIDDILPPGQQNSASTVWTNAKDKLTATGIDGGSKPGTVRIYNRLESFKFADADNTGFSTAYDFGGAYGMRTGTVVLHFGNLGTYKVGKAYKGTHNTEGEKTTSDETYIFHVGPIAELEVRDAGERPDLGTDQRAFTIVAVNNGPDDPPSAQVTVTGLNASDYVSHNATVGSFDSGTGVWTIGELKNREFYQANYGRDGEVLTIITTAAEGSEITAEIENTQDYQICIDSSADDVKLSSPSSSACTTEDSTSTWHTTKYYDYIDDNNSAPIAVREGTGADLLSLRGAQTLAAAVVVNWDPIEQLNGRPVTHYEVQRQTGNRWETVDEKVHVPQTVYVDTDVANVRAHRVRAVNDWGQAGAWSPPMSASAGGDVPSLTAAAVSSAAIRLNWTRPSGLSSSITRYQLQVSDRSSGPWTNATRPPGRSARSHIYSPETLTGGTRKYFRIRAVTQGGYGGWSAVAEATTLRAQAPGAPVGVSAEAEGGNVIVVAWDPPRSDGGSPITRYEVQWSADGGAWQDVGSTLDGFFYSLQHAGLEAGETRRYRVAARNEVGLGPWSGVVSATTRSDIADGPILTVEEVGPYEVRLEWEQYFPIPEAANLWRFDIQINVNGPEFKDSWFIIGRAGSGDREFRDRARQPGEKVYYRMRSVGPHGNSSWSNVVSSRTVAGAPDAPADLRAVASGENAIRLTWEEPRRDGGARVSRYQVWLSKNTETHAGARTIVEIDRSRCDQPESLACEYLHEGLGSGATWYYRVRAANHRSYQVGWGPYSDWVSTTTDTAQPQAQPQRQQLGPVKSFVAKGGSASRINLSWDWDPDEGDPQHYEIEYAQFVDGDGGDWQAVDPAHSGLGVSYSHTGLEPGDFYLYRVRAVNADGPGAWSLAATMTFPEAPANSPATGLPTISGTTEVGETLTADTSGIADEDGLTNATFSYQWQADGSDIQDATDSTYTLADSDEGKIISVTVSFTDDAGNAESLTSIAVVVAVTAVVRPNTPATGLPTISGTAQVGETLTADTSGIADEDGLTNATFSYQWQADGSDIQDATDSTYTLADSDEGKIISVTVSFTDDAGNTESLTSIAVVLAVTVVAGPNVPATGAPTVSGTARVGQTLTADTSGIADEDGLDNVSYNYQWKADGSDIAGATGSSYTLTDTEEGKAISVVVSFNDDAGNAESLTSAATAAVEAAFKLPVGETIVWSADMTVVDYETGAIGAGNADLFANQVSADNHRAQWLWSYTPDRQVNFALLTVIRDAEDLVLYIGELELPFADASGRFSNFTWDGVDVDWEGGQTLAVRIARPGQVPEPVENTPATGAPTISGKAQVGETLTADTSGISDADGLDNATFSYQWAADGADISGATDSTYTLVDADEGKAISVTVSFTDDAGNEESLTSAATGAVEARPNSPATGLPTINGTAQVAETLTADTSGISDADGLDNVSYSYQWVANDGSTDADISGATDSTYTLTFAEAEKTISVRVSFTDDRGNAETLTSAATEAVSATSQQQANTPATGAPVITGTAQVGETLTADTSGISDEDGMTNVSYSYQWKADGSDIAGATGSNYTPVDGNEGKGISLVVSFNDDAGNAESLTSAATAAVAAAEPEPVENTPATGQPAISGTPQVGQMLTADTSGIADEDGLTNAVFSYQWISNEGSNDADIAGATGSSYTLAEADQGKAIKVKVAFTDDAGNVESLTSGATATVAAKPNTPATGLPTITGTAQVGESLTAGTSGITDPDGLGNASFNYQWQADGADISGATDSTYTLVDADEGKAISVTVFFTDDAGNEESLTSAATGAVEAKPNTLATGQPVISGTAQVAETLTVDTSGISDDDGLDNVSYSYQWVSNDGSADSDIAGATESTYTLADADKGKTVKVRVSFTDDAGNKESLTSAATATVAAKPNTPATGVPIIAGTAQVGETLTADTSGIADEDGLSNVSYSYQWIVNERTDDGETTGASYNVVVEDDGATTWVPVEGTADTEIEGATGASYTLTDAEAGRPIRVRVSFTDDAGNEETLLSAPILLASIHDAPESHDGENAFTFELRFSEEFPISYESLRDYAFIVSGGDVTRAQRLEQGSDVGWRITVRPDGDGQVVITLPVTTNCNDQWAICTGDGRMLSSHLKLTVSGPGG